MKIKVSAIAAAMLAVAPAFVNAGTQIEIPHEKWTLFGTQGLYTYGTSSSSVPTWDTTYVLGTTSTDEADTDGNVTYYDNATGGTSGSGWVVSTPAIAEIGVELLVGSEDPSGNTIAATDDVLVELQHLGSVASSPNEYVKDGGDPVYTMYISTPGGNAVRVFFVSDMEGQWVKVRFNTETYADTTEFYWVKLHRDYTSDAPYAITTADLGVTPSELAALLSSSSSSTAYSGLDEYLDTNISDNNLTKVIANSMQLTSTDNFDAMSADDNLTLFGYVNGAWGVYDSRLSDSQNSLSSTNDVESAHGYWAYGQWVNNTTAKAGLVLASSDIGESTYGTMNLNSGWHLLSFNDETIRYSAAAAIVDISTSLGYTLRDTFGRNIAGTYWTEANATSALGAALATNDRIVTGDRNGTMYFGNTRAYPMNGTNVLIVSDRKFELNTSVATRPSSGTALPMVAANDNNQTAVYGDYLMAVKLNSAWLNEGNMTGIGHLEIQFADLYHEYTSSGTTVTDSSFYVSTAGATPATLAANIITNLTGSITGNWKKRSDDSTASDLKLKAYELDTNFDGTTDSVLIASNYRFGVADATVVRVYKDDNDQNGTQFYVRASGTDAESSLLSYDDYNHSYAIAQIAGARNDTTKDWNATIVTINSDTNYTVLGADLWRDSYTSTPINDIQILETGTDKGIYLDTRIGALSGSTDMVKGPISNVFTLKNLTGADGHTVASDYNGTFISHGYDLSNPNSSGVIDGNITLGSGSRADLTKAIYWADDMPANNPIQKLVTQTGKNVVSVLTAAQTSTTDGSVRWLGLDATKDADTWFDIDMQDTQELLWTDSKLGYWVRLGDDFTPATITLSNGVTGNSAGYVQVHFDNGVSATTGLGDVRNHINRTVTFKLNGLAGDSGTDYSDNSYNVVASVSGDVIPLRRNSDGTFTLRLNDAYILFADPTTSDVPVIITAYDGFGNTASFATSLYSYWAKPATPTVAYNATGTGLDITSSDTIQVFEGNISDYAFRAGTKTALSITDYSSLGELFGWDANSTLGISAISSTNPYHSLKVLAKNDYYMYSDMQAVNFAPVANSKTDTLTATVANTNYEDTENAVMLNVINYDGYAGSPLKIAFKGEANADTLSMTSATYYDVTTSGGSTIEMQITYHGSFYEGEVFYVYVDGTLYYGTFSTSYNAGSHGTLTEINDYGLGGQSF